jgi:archaeosortase B (VPXXXP-CTERM-specific)
MQKKKEIKTKIKKPSPIKVVISKFIIFSSLIIVVLTLLFSIDSIENFFIKMTAISANYLLNFFGINTKLSNNVITLLRGLKSSFKIIPDCTNIYPFIILTGFILAYPEKKKKKMYGIALAFLVSLIVNYVRLISIIAIAQKSVAAFEYAHIYIWQTSFVALVIFYFLWWIKWAVPTNKK